MKHELTEKLKTVSGLLDKYQKQRAELRKLKIKIERESVKYEFLSDILKIQGTPLVKPLVKFFRNIGYAKTYSIDAKKQEVNQNKSEDMQIIYKDLIIVCEVTSSKDNGNPPDTKCQKVASYVANLRAKHPNKKIHGLLIINSWIEQGDLIKRNKVPFNNSQIETSENMGYGLTTTKQLVNGYIKVRNGVITLEQFHDNLIRKGLIKF